MLARLKPTDPTVLAALADTANASLAEVNLVNTVVVANAHYLNASPEDMPKWRAFLEDSIATSDPLLIFHSVQGIMPYYQAGDILDYVPLLDHPAPDARTSAAWVILAASER